MKNKKMYLFFFLSFLISCNESADQIEKELIPEPSSLIKLTYPIGIGTTGDTINGLLGYGYDATGFCDTISVKAKIFDSLPSGDIFFGRPLSLRITLLSGFDFSELVRKRTYENDFKGQGEVLTQHLRSLLKLALKSDTIDLSYAYYYYSVSIDNAVWKLHSSGLDMKNYLSSDFKNEAIALSPNELVSKYGTHVLTHVSRGSKFEVLYRFKRAKHLTVNEFEDLFFSRKNMFIKGYEYKTVPSNVNTKFAQSSEQIIYNSIGSNQKLCGLINLSDHNPDSISIDISDFFSEYNTSKQITTVPLDGALPIYELISDVAKKQAVKAYIENKMTINIK
jgi:hypothetical protein